MKIKLMLVIALVTLMSVFMSGCGSETKLGYLDAERVMNEAPQIKTIRDNIDAKNKEIEAKETDLMSKKQLCLMKNLKSPDGYSTSISRLRYAI